MKKIVFGLALVFLLPGAVFLTTTDWKTKEEQYSIRFDTKGASGSIKGLSGIIRFDSLALEQSLFDVTVDVRTLTTGNHLKDNHTLAKEFLYAEEYPTIRFVSEKLSKSETGYLVSGKLTIKATTKDVTILFRFKEKGNEGTFEGKFQINRKDYELHKNGVGEVIDVIMVLPVVK